MTRTQLQAALKRAGRQRGIAAEADRLRDVLRAEWAHQPQLVKDALGRQMLALLIQLEAASKAGNDLEEAVGEMKRSLSTRTLRPSSVSRSRRSARRQDAVRDRETTANDSQTPAVWRLPAPHPSPAPQARSRASPGGG